MKLLFISVFLVGLAFAGIAIKILVKKEGSLQEHVQVKVLF